MLKRFHDSLGFTQNVFDNPWLKDLLYSGNGTGIILLMIIYSEYRISNSQPIYMIAILILLITLIIMIDMLTWHSLGF